MDENRLEQIERDFRRRYRKKKALNLIISAAIFVLGLSSVIYIWNYDGDGLMTFRWMTVDGTIFTSAISLIYVVVNLIEMIRYTELTSRAIYYMRLAAAAAETLIMVVVLISQLPFSPQHMHLFRYDMFNMHLLIPVLTVASFVTNDSPIGKIKPVMCFHGTWFVTLYATVVLTLILTGVVPRDMIPYAFMDVKNMSFIVIASCLLFVYSAGFLFSLTAYYLNRKLSWLWFRGVASGQKRR